MRYCEDNGEITVTAEEAVAFSLFHYLGTSPTEALLPLARAGAEDRVRLGLPAEGVSLACRFPSGDHTFCLTAVADAVTGMGRDRTLTLVAVIAEPPETPAPTTVRAARALAYLAASCLEGKTPPRLCILYDNPALGRHHSTEETVTQKKLAAFLERVTAPLFLYAQNEIVRVSRRLPAMRRLRFPYPETRLCQEELMSAVFRAVCRGKRLFASAPTGIGKTVSTLYPAVRAMGEGKCDKVFYLTAKATAARMAGETAALLGKDGALRAVLLASKERLCPRRGVPCREGTPCENRRGGAREDIALSELVALGLPLIGPEEIAATAARHGVCPHELSLSYSMLSDVVICDYNYLFDPTVRLSRFFSLGGRFAFLVDEAHNLGDRIRDTYTVTLTTDTLMAAPLRPPDEGRTLLADVLSSRDTLVARLLSLTPAPAEDGPTMLRSLPEWLPLSLSELLTPLAALVRDRRTVLPPEFRKPVRRFYYDLKTILDTLAAYDAGFRLEVFKTETGGVGVRTLCLDPSGVVSRCLGDGKSAVLFSATLSPIAYYRDTLGGEREDEVLELASPFLRDNLAVAVMDKISTRYADREATLPEVGAAVLAAVRARRGNYMVFCPSFAYGEALYRHVRAQAPDLRTLLQGRTMSPAERSAFLSEFEKTDDPLVAFCVMGGIWGEGIDLLGDRLIGAVIVGVGLGTPDPLHEEMARYFREKNDEGAEYAYIYPGINRVLQAAGRVIRSENDVGIVVLIDDRFATPVYRRALPAHWHGLSYVGNVRSLSEYLRRFWSRHPEGEEHEGKEHKEPHR